jgi:hypothetical protein
METGFSLNLPQPRYKPILIGMLQVKSDLERLLEDSGFQYSDYIIKCQATKVCAPSIHPSSLTLITLDYLSTWVS